MPTDGSSGRSGLPPATPRSSPWSEKARYGLRPAAAHPQRCAATPVEAPGDRSVRARPQTRSGQEPRMGLPRVRRGDRLVTVSGVPSPDPSWNQHFSKPTPAQTQVLASIENSWPIPPLASGESVGRPSDSGVRAGPLRGRFRSKLSRALEAAGSSRQGARAVQTARAARVPDRDHGSGTGTRSGVREGWDIALGEQWRDYRLRLPRPAPPSPLIPPSAPCTSRLSLRVRPLRARGQGRLLLKTHPPPRPTWRAQHTNARCESLVFDR